jgi:8-oxo-dGTP pyrophosphatase MutT (NUDIX family)
MKQEHSAGGVVYRRYQIPDTRYQIQFLLGRHSGYHKWVLPKGLIEVGEIPAETAIREVFEEMGVGVRIIGDAPIKTIEYEYWAEMKQIPDTRHQKPEKQPVRRVKKYQEDEDFGSAKEKQLVKKQVDFFLMEWVSGVPADHDYEMEEAGWFSYEAAMKKLAFADERDALTVARDKIFELMANG